MADIRIMQLPSGTPSQSKLLPMDLSTTEKATIKDVVYAGRPSASQAEAEAGTDPDKVMTPLNVKQAITATAATSAQGAKADTALQPSAIGTDIQAYSANLTDLAGTTPGTAGKSILGLNLAADVRDYLDTAPYVSTRTALKALDTTKERVASLTESPRYGAFVWVSGDFSTQIASDTLEGVYLKADAIAASSGAWVRMAYLQGEPVDVKWFAAPLNGTSSDDAAFSVAAKLANAQVTYNSFYGQQTAPVKGWVGYTEINADWTIAAYGKSDVDGNMRLSHTMGADSQVGRAEVFSGLRARYLVLRYRLNTAGAVWDGSVYWQTGSHSYSNSFRKFAPAPTVGVWSEVALDMWAPDAGGTDWRDNTITSIRIDFLADNSPDATVDWAFAKLCEEALPNPESGTVRVPFGDVKLTQNVDSAGKDITWVIDSGVKFVDDCAVYLTGRTSRPERVNLRRPHGRLDSATGFSVQVGDGFFGYSSQTSDIPSQTNGWLTPSDAAVYLDNGTVGVQADIAGSPVITVSSPTYALTGASWAAAIDTSQVKVGDEVRTLHSPPWRAVITSIATDGKSITVPAWYQLGDTTKTPGTPPSTQNMIINPLDKVWASNFNTFITSSNFTYQSAVVESGLYNSKAVPSSAEDGNGRTWGYDIVNLGPNKGSMGFIQRGSFFEGYRASGSDIGFRSAAYAGLGYSAPPIGFDFQGGGTAFRALNTSGNIDFSVAGGVIELGAQGAVASPTIDFHSGAAFVDYDARIQVTGGDGVAGNGTILLNALLTNSRNLRPVADNSYQLGGSSARWTTVFATTGTINTSDPSLKRFYDAYDAADSDRIMRSLKRAVQRISIRLYQWLDSIDLKGDSARLHIGVSASDVDEAFAAEGLDARRFALFCEDEEMEIIEIAEDVQVPDMEEIEETYFDEEDRGDHVVIVERVRRTSRPMIVEKPILNQDGTPVMQEAAVTDPDGNPVVYGNRTLRTMKPAMAMVPVMKTKRVMSYKEVPTGRKRLALRYDQLMLLMIAAHR